MIGALCGIVTQTIAWRPASTTLESCVRSSVTQAMHAQPLSLDGFPRGPVTEVGRSDAAGSAPDATQAIGTSEGVVPVFTAQRDPTPAEPQLHSTLLRCR